MLVLSDISKSYDDVNVLNSISLTFETGRTSVLIGPSGCGKSTLLRLVTGLVQADSGYISLDGEVVNQDRIMALRQQMGYVIQDGGLFPHLTARENICLYARYRGWAQGDIESRLTKLAGLFRFASPLLDRYPAEISGGQKQRVSIMRAMMPDPGLLLLDEPLAALDPMIRYELQEELRNIFRELGKTVLLVTHDMGEAGYLGDHIVLLREGDVAQQGTMHALLNSPANEFVEKFIQAQRQPWQYLEGFK